MRSRAIRIGTVAVVASAALCGGSGVASAGGGCHNPPTASRGDTVEVTDLCFVATVLYVEPGTEVTWTNRDPMTHDVVGVGGIWGDPAISLLQGDDVSYRFDQTGVYPYACWIHPGMVGAIVVGDGVGTGVAGVVLDAGRASETTSTKTGPAPAVQEGAVDPTIIWIAGAALLLAALGGAYAMVARTRRKGAVAG